MAALSSRFSKPLSEAEEASLRASSVPSNTKVATEWGIGIWSEWVASCMQVNYSSSSDLNTIATNKSC